MRSGAQPSRRPYNRKMFIGLHSTFGRKAHAVILHLDLYLAYGLYPVGAFPCAALPFPRIQRRMSSS